MNLSPKIEASPNSIAIIGDLHVPFQDDYAVNRAFDIIRKRQPEMIVVNGDLLDCFEISKYNRVPRFSPQIDEEITLAKSILSDLRKENPTARIVFVEGNHEFRLRSYLARQAGELYHLFEKHLPLSILLGLNELGIDIIQTKKGAAKFVDTFFEIDNIYIGHWDKSNLGSGMTARNLLIRKNETIVQSHVHRGGIIYKRKVSGEIIFGMEVPCLCQFDMYYSSECDFQQGLGFLNKDDKGVFRPEVIVF